MITGFDHVVILAGDLMEAMRRYQEIGFAVDRGGAHPAWGTENALVPLADGAYLELLAAIDPSRAVRHRLWLRPDGGGRASGEYGGYALGCQDIAGEVAPLRRGGVIFGGPQAGSRIRPDQQIVKWRTAFSDQPTLPFLIEDETPRELRIAPALHGLGANMRITEIAIAVGDLSETVQTYQRFLDMPGARGRSSPNTGNVRFKAPWGTIVLISPQSPDPARSYLDRVGPGVFSVVLNVRRWGEVTEALHSKLQIMGDTALIDPAQTGGTRILLQPETDSS